METGWEYVERQVSQAFAFPSTEAGPQHFINPHLVTLMLLCMHSLVREVQEAVNATAVDIQADFSESDIKE